MDGHCKLKDLEDILDSKNHRLVPTGLATAAIESVTITRLLSIHYLWSAVVIWIQ